eukprot:TRINITY_DN21393_c0_g1_i3.p1 TRINITY_DN21393_c0_g1~~TRINITY_DN21393_c0_g1_i3.p1  ORF type:complete len:545 (-),score=102.56 TRINITY_DN21393_c0_g1_i3:44-1507(-)
MAASPKQAGKGAGPAADDDDASLPRVLLVGAGCTGALTAALLRRETARRRVAHRMTVWEWGRGPAGRMSSFWTEVGGERVLADVGAQVISLRDPADLPDWISPIVLEAGSSGLARTDERRHDWRHFHVPAGLSSMQRASLEAAQPDELHFNRRLLELGPGSARRWRVGYAGERGGRRPAGYEEFDVVLFAGTAADAGGNEGVRNSLSPTQQCLRFHASPGCYRETGAARSRQKPPVQDMAASLEWLCGGRAEVVPDDETISLVALQGAKGRGHAAAKACAVTLHGTLTFAKQNEQVARQLNKPPKETGMKQMVEALAKLLEVPLAQLRGSIIDSKLVHWRQCQVDRPYAGNTGDGPCLVSAADSSLILAGDYLAGQELAGSFEGCLASAGAAAAAATELLLGKGSQAAVAGGLKGRLSRRDDIRGAGDEASSSSSGQKGGARAGRWTQRASADSCKGAGKGAADGGGKASYAASSSGAGRRWQKASN